MIKDHLGNEYKSIEVMAKAYGLKPRTLYGRLKRMSVEQALVDPIKHKPKTECKDHLGNTYESKAKMCEAYGMDRAMFFGRMKMGWSLEDALTKPFQELPPNTKSVKDHTGQEFVSVSEMCKHWNMTRTTYNARMKAGWSKEDALTKPKKDINIKQQSCKDHKGNEYPSINAMCRAYGIKRYMFQTRRKNGWDLEKALTEPTIVNAIECSDGFGNTFPSIRDLCNYYDIPIHEIQGHNKTESEIKDSILKRFRANKTLGNIHIKRCINFPYYLVQHDDREVVMEFSKILYIFHNSDAFKPVPETKVKHKHIRSVTRIEFPYYNIVIDDKEMVWSYWNIIKYNKESNFGL